MSTSIEALEVAFRSLLSTKPWTKDSSVVPIPWRQEILDAVHDRAIRNGKPDGHLLKLGVLWNDGSVQPHPPVRRGLQMAVDAIRGAGHNVINWSPPKQTIAQRIHVSFLFADGAHDVHNQLERSGEPLIPELRKAFRLRDPVSLLEYQDSTLQGLEYELKYNDYWESTGKDDGNDNQAQFIRAICAYICLDSVVDAVIMPVAPHAAVIPGKYFHTGRDTSSICAR